MNTADDQEDNGIFAEKLELLFETMRRPDGTRYTDSDVEAGTAQLGGRVTSTYVFRLRRGMSRNPSYDKIKVLSTFFDVSPAYFFEEESEPVRLNSKAPDLQQLALRAEAEIEDEAVKNIMVDMMAAIMQAREGAEKE